MSLHPADPYAASTARVTVRSDARLRAVTDAVSDAIVAADADGLISMWTGGAEAIFGWSAAEAVGRPLVDLIPERYRAAHTAGFARVRGGAESAVIGRPAVALEGLRKDGTEFPVELTLSRGLLGDQPFFVGVIRDVTERRRDEDRLRLATERFRSAFEHAAVGMTMSSPDGRYLRVNRVFCELLQYSEEELTAMGFTDVTHPDDQPTDAERVRQMLAGELETTRVEKRYLRKDGRAVWVDLTVSLLRDADGQPLHFITQVQDISERRRAAEELQRSNEELAQFAAVASHDLNEPLRLVDGYLRLLESRYGDRLDDQAGEFLGYAVEGVERMRALIDALLRYARVGTGTLPRVQVDAAAVAREARDALALAISERGAVIEIGPLPTLDADATLLRQVFQNLLHNAIRFADRDHPVVRVSAEPVSRPAGWCFSVADNGPGIAPGERERVFEMFNRGSAEPADGRGTGIGLAICKRAIERLGGTIAARDAAGGGADVRFTIPVRERDLP